MPTIRMLIFRMVLILPVVGTLRTRADEDQMNPLPSPPPHYERVMIIPIHDMIEPALLYIIRRGVQEALDIDAQAVVFAMNTPGGRVDTTEEIVELIEGIRVPTYTLVERNAISAGSIIALATDHIYMMPGSKIGDAMPIMASPQGGMQSLGEAEREKIESYVDSLVRGIAQRKGRDETMASAMVRRSVEYKIGDEVISPEGQILTLTHLEAEKQYEIDGVMRPLLSEGTVADEAEFLSLIAAPDAVIQRVEPSEFEQVARMIAAIAPILLTIGMLGLWIEFQTPGVGWAGLLGALCLGLFFFGHHIAGLAGQEDLLLFLLGIGLIAVEIFVLPGFGVIGLMGILIVLWSLLSAMTPTLPDGSWMPDFQNMADPAKRLA
ncbi:MAG: ATP-dependent Clp protease proteolytic subunit, partial [Kiritimatiellae bacterium]|nr:ATP-dependent Clp protease proteolytic subunit [Kiritimatiellia bacterium]